jgi:hypothetical protein
MDLESVPIDMEMMQFVFTTVFPVFTSLGHEPPNPLSVVPLYYYHSERHFAEMPQHCGTREEIAKSCSLTLPVGNVRSGPLTPTVVI